MLGTLNVTENWRIVDTGLRAPAQNIALNRALLEARRAKEIPGTLRFQRFAPCALLGNRQSAAQEFDLDYCHANRITIQRRITGGSAIYCDENQVGWELYLHEGDVGTTEMRAISRRICHAAATAISALGIDARYRARGDIVVDGRRICSAAGAFDGDALLFQGMVHIDLDVEKMLHVMHLCPEQYSDKTIAHARERVVGLKELLGPKIDALRVKENIAEAFGSEFDVEFSEGELTLSEHARYEAALREIDTPDWVNLIARPAAAVPVLEAQREIAGALLQARVALDTTSFVVRQVMFHADVRIVPRSAVPDLEAGLLDVPLDQLEARVHAFFRDHRVEMPPLAPADFIEVVRQAVGAASVIKIK